MTIWSSIVLGAYCVKETLRARISKHQVISSDCRLHQWLRDAYLPVLVRLIHYFPKVYGVVILDCFLVGYFKGSICCVWTNQASFSWWFQMLMIVNGFWSSYRDGRLIRHSIISVLWLLLVLAYILSGTLKSASRKLIGDREIVMAAVKNNGHALEYV